MATHFRVVLTASIFESPVFTIDLVGFGYMATKSFAANWLDVHCELCTDSRCDVGGWQVWAANSHGANVLLSRFPARV